MRTILLLTLLLVLRSSYSAQIWSRPASLPTEARHRLATIREIFKRNFEQHYTQRKENKQFLVITVGDTGFTEDDPLPLWAEQNIFNLDQSEDAGLLIRTWTDDPHRGFLDDISHRTRDFVQHYGDLSRGAGKVHILIHNLPSYSYQVFTDTLVQLAGEYPSMTFHLGYEVALITNTTLTRDALHQLSRTNNIKASNVRGSVRYEVLHVPRGLWINVLGNQQPMLLAANEQLHRGPLPQNPNDAWLSQATTIGSRAPNWNSYRHLLLSPNGPLYGVRRSEFLTGNLPIGLSDTMSWRPILESVSDIGRHAKHVLFHPNGSLYWVHEDDDGLFYLGDPDRFNAVPVEARVGATGWADFQFLTFDPKTNHLFGVVNGQIFAAPPPESPNRWTAQAVWLGTRSWDLFTHLFFDPHGVLYAVTQDDRLMGGPPPEYPTDCWNCRARVISQSGWQDFKFLFFDPTEGRV